MAAECVIGKTSARHADELVERLAKLRTPVVSDVLGRSGGMPGIMPLSGLAFGGVVTGHAYTVRTLPGDNLVVHRAIDLAPPGDILVVSAGGGVSRAIVGGLMVRYAQSRGLAGLVIDGPVRDIVELQELAIPVFGTGVCHLGPFKVGSGEICGVVSMAGQTVCPGDLIIGDGDGVAAVPGSRVPEIVSAAEAKEQEEQSAKQAILEGRWDRNWLDVAIRTTRRTS